MTSQVSAVCLRSSIWPLYPIKATAPKRRMGIAITTALGQVGFLGSSLSSVSLAVVSIAGSPR